MRMSLMGCLSSSREDNLFLIFYKNYKCYSVKEFYGRKSGLRQDGHVDSLTILGKHSEQQMLCCEHLPITFDELSD